LTADIIALAKIHGRYGVAEVAAQMASTCHLDSVRRALTDPVGIRASTITGDDLDARMRQASIAAMTRRSTRPRWPSWLRRNASPWWRKISATSSAGRITVAQGGGVTSSRSRSSGLGVPRMVLLATWA